jgi:hypothetical protein
MTLQGYEHLPGLRLDPGHIAIDRAEATDLAAVLGTASPRTEQLHPLYAFIATQRGIGVSVPGLCRLVGRDLTGAIMGGIDLELFADLAPDTTYSVEGEIVDFVRKTSSSLGEFDLLTYREWLAAPTGEVVARTTNTFIFPLGGER